MHCAPDRFTLSSISTPLNRETTLRKQLIGTTEPKPSEATHNWMDLEALARIELSSEDPAHPIEAAMLPGGTSWRAADSGKQTISLLFDDAQHVGAVRLVFEESQRQHTQEFVLRWTSDGATWHDIARQQYNFSSPDSTCEIEEYNVDLHGVTGLSLSIIPEISGGDAIASLAEWRIA